MLGNSKFLTPIELAERWSIPKRTLETWRQQGTGPQYHKLGKHVRYRLDEIEKFEEHWRSTNQFDSTVD